ncbi:hypothetical protein FE845_11375 [Marinobacter sp. 1-4A]|uniref:hypothetical protein n=1 Tax=Marinobacter sp. 1-4A TaxID=2582919 RepID=UPI001908CA40|nr:hypothetical protein [Marinobacter sp. 1-4A]MBK1851944.1 hypothetical protein [Marinobacter sp. 1-4A]
MKNIVKLSFPRSESNFHGLELFQLVSGVSALWIVALSLHAVIITHSKRLSMKTLIAMVLIFSASSIQAKSISDTLEGNEVNHFQLLVNNLNMLYIAVKDFDTKNEENKGEPREIYTKFRADKENRLFISALYEAPFIQVTSDECDALLEEDRTKMLSMEKGLPQMINLVSYYDLSGDEVAEITAEARYQVTIQAKENKELSVTCMQ